MYTPQLNNLKTILCLGSHSDDIEIGCGGTVLKLLRECPGVVVHWVVLSSEGERAGEARTSAERFLNGSLNSRVLIQDFRDRYFPAQYEAIKDFVHGISGEVSPDLIFTHRLEDRHQDHRLVSELTWNAFRKHLIFEYEIPKYEGDLGQPNVFVPLEKDLCDTKINITYESFESQQEKPWFTPDTFSSLMRLRGLECHSPSGYAEAFHCRKMTL
ncbi:MAG: PIG-L family deacetylase [Planctomycetes bacterium]|nr:PIG-L family deacetylase [Planctomycetota bacterium]